jgi:hypothetical protein
LQVEGSEKTARGGEYEPIKNSLRGELGICPKIDPTHLSSSSIRTT